MANAKAVRNPGWHVNTYLNKLWQPGDVREIRAFKRGTPYQDYGYFDCPNKATRSVMKLLDTHDVYVTLNPCTPSLIARCANRIKRCYKSDNLTSDHDIPKLIYLLVDLDPNRPAGISASDEELANAYELAKVMIKDLGVPRIFGMSGNGFHLIYKHNATDKRMLQKYLEILENKYGGNGVKIDRAVFNPARISKVLGTWARKGDSVNDRPHRQSRVLRIPK